MCTATAEAPARWADLPVDLLSDISRRLTATAGADYIRFHAVCRSWRDARAHIPPAFLPWLLAPPDDDDTGQRKARFVFPSKSSPRRAAATVAIEIRVPDRGWVIGTDDGAAARCLLARTAEKLRSFDDPFTGSASSAVLPPYPAETKPWVNRAAGVVSSDGTAFVHGISLSDEGVLPEASIFMALARPGDAEWTVEKAPDLRYRRNGPVIASNEEIRADLELLQRSCFTIYVGNLSRTVDSNPTPSLSSARGMP